MSLLLVNICMNDVQLILSIRKRANRRLGNFLFIKVLDALEIEARELPLERPVIQRFRSLCVTYNVRLDETEKVCMCKNRLEVVGSERQDRLRRAGLGV